MKKFISYFTFALCTTVTLVSCNKEDGDGLDGYSNAKEGYIEVTIDGKTYKETVKDLYYLGYEPIEEWGKETLAGYVEDFDRENGFELTWSFICYEDPQKLLDCPIGEYPYECQNDENLSFHICYYEDPNREFDESFYKNRGSHQVTSIRKKGKHITVEGTFDATLGDNELNIKGKYQFIISCE